MRAALQAIVHGKTKKAGRRARFTETVEAAVHLAVDPKRSDQIVRGTAFLPHSVGRKEVVAVFVDDDEDAAAAKAARLVCRTSAETWAPCTWETSWAP